MPKSIGNVHLSLLQLDSAYVKLRLYTIPSSYYVYFDCQILFYIQELEHVRNDVDNSHVDAGNADKDGGGSDG